MSSINLRQKRFTEGVNRILQEELQNGNLPTSKEFAVRLNRFLREQDLAGPEYIFRRARNGEIAESNFYNEAVEKIQRDLQIIYENTISTHNVLESKFNWFEIEKNRLEYEVNRLRNELKEKILLYGKTGYITSLFETFDDHSKIESEENVVVDIKKHQAMLKQQENTSYIIHPPCSITFNMPLDSVSTFKRIPISGKIENALTSHNNEAYQEVWLSRSSGKAEGYVEIIFDDVQVLNRMDINIHTLRETNIYIEFSSDSHNFFHLPYYPNGVNTVGDTSFHFPTTKIKIMRIWLRKSDSDKEIVHPDGFQYEYLFGVKNISFYQLSYPNEGVILTKEMIPYTDSNFSIGKVSLITEEELVDGTDIEYYIRTNSDEAWKQISPINRDSATAPNLIDFKYITKGDPINLGAEDYIYPQSAEVIELKTNGISFYAIGAIEKKKIISQTERLYIGKNAYSVQIAEQDHGESHIPSIKDWEKPLSNIVRFIQPTEEGKRGLLIEDKNFDKRTQLFFQMGLFSEQNEQVLSTVPLSTEPIAIFLNGEKIFEGIPSSQTTVNYKFKGGWNNLVVLVYVSKPNNPVTVDLGFDPLTVCTYCYSNSKPLEKVSVFDLQYNVKNNDWSKYALYEKGDKVYIVMNYFFPQITYDFFCDYIDEIDRKTIQMKIIFKQNHIGRYTTPILKRYTLQFS